VTERQLLESPESRIIIFASFRDMVQQIVDFLGSRGIPAERFVGQATKDTERGLSQKKQIEALDRFRAGAFRVLVATSVGEEGLDVPSTDMVIFYEAVPSEIRSIQRKGRTGRSGSGRVVVLVTKGTSDETYRFVSLAREKAMASGIRRFGGRMEIDPAGPAPRELQKKIEEFTGDLPEIVVDDRETSSPVVERLSGLGVRISIRRLGSGDYAIGERVLVERKRARDFVDTLVERDLFGQMRDLASQALRPVLIIEGGDLYTQRDIQQNALRGTLSAIAIDLGIAVFFTRDEEDTAQLLAVIARREKNRGDRPVRLPLHKAARSTGEEMELVIASFPEIGAKNARVLLSALGSIRAVVTASEEELAGVRGIGEKKARRIAELSRKEYS
jgi:Fanconi anemia group M protein